MLIIRWYLKDTYILVTDDSKSFSRIELKMLKDMISPYLYKFRDIGLLYISIPSYRISIILFLLVLLMVCLIILIVSQEVLWIAI